MTGDKVDVSLDYEIQASLAEALHVDGEYDRAAALWEGLAQAGYLVAEAAFKAAISYFASGKDEEAVEWLEKAREAGIAEEEVVYVSAQRHWRNGEVRTAMKEFRQVQDCAAEPSRASNALGVLLWQLGRINEARQQFELALEQNRNEADALINRVSIDFHDWDEAEASGLLRDCVSLQPHRSEPFVLFSRLCRRNDDVDGARQALAKARLRKASLGQPPEDMPLLVSRVCGEVTVRGTISKETVSLSISYKYFDDGEEAWPAYLAVNVGYERVEVDGAEAVVTTDIVTLDELAGMFTDNVRFLGIPKDSWKRIGNGWLLEVNVIGLPVPPCVAMKRYEFEFDGCSAWLPIPLSGKPMRWAVDVELPPDFKYVVSSHEPERYGVGLLAFAKAGGCKEYETVTCALEVAKVGDVDRTKMRLARYPALKTIDLWTELAGPTRRPRIRLMIVNRPKSQFCYSRPEYIRLADGIFRHEGGAALVCHEVGHLWWGVDVRFVPGDEWLGEALAEYSVHLAEHCGLLPGYLKATLAMLEALGGGELPATGLARLGGQGREAAYVLRAKGGFVISMLRCVMGEEAFRRLMFMAHEIGATRQFDAYTFFALASRVHGATLNWFVNQWVYTDAYMAFKVEDIQGCRLSSAFAISFQAECTGVATPGAPVEFGIQTEDGHMHVVELTLDLGKAAVTVDTASLPTRIVADPSHRWYAKRTDVDIKREDLL